MSGERYDIIGLGTTAVDEFIYVPRFPTEDTKMAFSRRMQQCGGLTATALVAASRLGARCAYAGQLGDDDLSATVAAALRREGVDLSHAVQVAEARPYAATILVVENSGTRTILARQPEVIGAHPRLPAAEVIRSAKALFVDPKGLDGQVRAAEIARAAGMAVIGDVEHDAPGLGRLLPLIDHLIVPRKGAAELCGEGDPGRAAAALLRDDRDVVVVTCGAEGGWVASREQETARHFAAYGVEVVDTTGCGDAFHGAYAAAWCEEMPLYDRVRWAAATAALKAMHPGGQSGLPTRKMLEDFLRSRA